MHRGDVFGIRRSFIITGLVSLLIAILLIQAVCGKNSDDEDDEVTFKDFNLNVGDRIDLSDYQMELIEIQSVRDGLVVMRISKVGGSLDEQRALLLDSPNNFDGGAEKKGVTITITDIFDDQSAKVRVEYLPAVGTARKRTSERALAAPEKPELSVQKIFEKNQIGVGDEIKVTIIVKNTGTGPAESINVQDIPPLPEFTYVAGYPPKIKEVLGPGESDSAVYVIDAAKEGTVLVPAMIVTYADSKKNAKSNSSEPFNVVINPKSKADLDIQIEDVSSIALDQERPLNISIFNRGTASATRIVVTGEVSPSQGLQATGLDKSFFEILPGESANYSAGLNGQIAGSYTVRIKASYDGGNGYAMKEGISQVAVLQQEYKYQYLLLIIPVGILLAWVYRRYREYKY